MGYHVFTHGIMCTIYRSKNTYNLFYRKPTWSKCSKQISIEGNKNAISSDTVLSEHGSTLHVHYMSYIAHIYIYSYNIIYI